MELAVALVVARLDQLLGELDPLAACREELARLGLVGRAKLRVPGHWSLVHLMAQVYSDYPSLAERPLIP